MYKFEVTHKDYSKSGETEKLVAKVTPEAGQGVSGEVFIELAPNTSLLLGKEFVLMTDDEYRLLTETPTAST